MGAALLLIKTVFIMKSHDSTKGPVTNVSYHRGNNGLAKKILGNA